MSKFDKIFENRNNQTGAEEGSAPEPETEKIKPRNSTQNSFETQLTNSILAEKSSGTDSIPKKLGRPATGKKNDPIYVGFTTYIRRDTHTAVKIKLLQDGERRELSELVEELLQQWVKQAANI